MKKIININFQGRVIPIEETAYDILKQYIESLRRYFANEEGRDEIINDIESRIAELFSDRLKNTSCITDDDVNAVIAGMGRPQDFEEAEGQTSSGGTTAETTAQEEYQQQGAAPQGRRLYRAENDKVLGGVCAGLANYFGIDPAIMRLIFVLFLFMGFGFLLYIILWIVVPSKALITNVRKRLYRNPDQRMIGGVASGIAAYLNIDVWIPRIIFLMPFIIGILSRSFRHGFFDFNPVPNFLFNGFGGSLFIIYIVLWIVLPEATTATEKLEMRGEKVDLESIKKTVKEDLENLKGRAEKVGAEMKEGAQQMGQDIRQASRNFATESAPVVRRTGSGLGHAIGVLFKAFFLFVAGIIVFSLLMVLVALLFSGVGVFPFKDFLLEGPWQNLLAWSTLILFLGVPIIAILIWLIRRLMRVKSKSNYLGYVFGSLWFIGLFSAIVLAGMLFRNFRSKTSIREAVPVVQPSNDKLLIKVTEGNVKYYGSDWFGFDHDDDWPFYSLDQDSIMMNTVRLKIVKSEDSLFHLYALKFSSGNTPSVAEQLANRIQFPITQVDSTLYLPKGFAITRNDKFRNQQVLVVVEVPINKKIEVDRSLDQYKWFDISMNHRRGWNIEWNDRWDNAYYWNNNVEYLMTPGGLEDIERKRREAEEERRRENRRRDSENEGEIRNDVPGDPPGYRYRERVRERRDSASKSLRDSIGPTVTYEERFKGTTAFHSVRDNPPQDIPAPLYKLLKVFQ
jgi:phage shock protein PspC (stress-responsive transcriptional regulator)